MAIEHVHNIVIVEHEANEVGPGHALERYFLEQDAGRLRYIGHPNLYMKTGFAKVSRTILHRHGRGPVAQNARLWKLPEWCLYIKDCLYTFYWIARDSRRYDLFVGLGNMNALCGVLLKKLGKVNKVVYYVIDYIPDRFQNRLLNTIYVYAERFAAAWSDYTWNISPRMIEARNARWNRRFANQLVVPHGLYLDKKIPLRAETNSNELIYMGNLNQEQGIQLVIEAIVELKEVIPDITFAIIGTGNYEKELKQLVRDLYLGKSVRFLGSIRDDHVMVGRLKRAAVAVAMYRPDHKFAVYADPGKIKYYLSAGLPIVLTGNPHIAQEIDQYAGYMIPYDTHALVDKVTVLLRDRRVYRRFQRNALRLAKRYDWTAVFSRALNTSI